MFARAISGIIGFQVDVCLQDSEYRLHAVPEPLEPVALVLAQPQALAQVDIIGVTVEYSAGILIKASRRNRVDGDDFSL